MKVTKTSTQPTFQPIELKITIESQEEYVALKEMVWFYTGRPRAMVEGSHLYADYQNKVESFFSLIKECL